MKLATLRFVAPPLVIAAGALVLREGLRDSPAEPTPGHGTPLVPEAVVALLARRLPSDAEFAVDPSQSRARLSSDVDANWADESGEFGEFDVDGRFAFDAHGDLCALTLALTPQTLGPAEAPRAAGALSALAYRPRATPVPALRAAFATARFTLANDTCDVEFDVRWTALPDGSVVAQGEARVPCAGFGLPPAAWPRMLRDPAVGMLAFDLVLTRRE